MTCQARPVFSRRDPHPATERPAEVALVEEAKVLCDRADAGFCASELLFGHLDASCHHILDRTGANARAESSGEMEPADACRSRHLLKADGVTKVVVQVTLHGCPRAIAQRSNTTPATRRVGTRGRARRCFFAEVACVGRCCLLAGMHGGSRDFDAVMVFPGQAGDVPPIACWPNPAFGVGQRLDAPGRWVSNASIDPVLAPE